MFDLQLEQLSYDKSGDRTRDIIQWYPDYTTGSLLKNVDLQKLTLTNILVVKSKIKMKRSSRK